MFRRFLPVVQLASLALALVVVATAAQAQERKVRSKITGKVEEVSEGRMVIIDASDNQTKLAFQINNRSEVEVDGTADLAYLTPGVSVHFIAEMTAANVVPDPLTEITVCNVDDENNKPICILADPTKARKKDKDAVNKMEVRGTIKAIKNGKVTIDVPSQRKSQQVKITLAPDAKVVARFTDLAMVQKGDEVFVPWAQEIDPVLLVPRSIKIKLANPLVSEKKAPASRKSTAKSSK